MTGARDMQKAKLYRAEREAFGFGFSAVVRYDRHSGRHSSEMTLPDCEAFIDKVCCDAWVRRTFGTIAPRVADGRGTRIARGSPDRINLPRWARTKPVILHELAHGLTRKAYGPSPAPHGWEFASVYLRLVQHFLGKDRADQLRAAFKKHRVRTAPKRTRPMSDEAKAILRARLAGYRAAAAEPAPVEESHGVLRLPGL